MAKTIIYVLLVFILIFTVTAIQYNYIYNPYTGKLDRSVSINQSESEFFYKNLSVDNLKVNNPPIECSPNYYMTYYNGSNSICSLVDLSAYVPYSGATGDVDLGDNTLTVGESLTVGFDNIFFISTISIADGSTTIEHDLPNDKLALTSTSPLYIDTNDVYIGDGSTDAQKILYFGSGNRYIVSNSINGRIDFYGGDVGIAGNNDLYFLGNSYVNFADHAKITSTVNDILKIQGTSSASSDPILRFDSGNEGNLQWKEDEETFRMETEGGEYIDFILDDQIINGSSGAITYIGDGSQLTGIGTSVNGTDINVTALYADTIYEGDESLEDKYQAKITYSGTQTACWTEGGKTICGTHPI